MELAAAVAHETDRSLEEHVSINDSESASVDSRSILHSSKFKVLILSLFGLAATSITLSIPTNSPDIAHCVDDCLTQDLNSKMHNGIMEERTTLYEEVYAARPLVSARAIVSADKGPFSCVDREATIADDKVYPCSNIDVLSVLPVESFGFRGELVQSLGGFEYYRSGPTDECGHGLILWTVESMHSCLCTKGL